MYLQYNTRFWLIMRKLVQCSLVVALDKVTLSPYLYILCTEGLSSLIKNAERRGSLHGIKICRRPPIITHLFFADDSFLFLRATDQEALCVKDLLHKYEMASGQALNLSK